MDNMVHMNMRELELEEMDIIQFYKRQLDAYHRIKKEAEKVQWADARYDAFVSSMNAIGKELAALLQSLSDGDNVYILTELMQFGKDYLENERKFPSL